MWNPVAVLAILLAAAPASVLCTDAACSPEEMDDPQIKCACVLKGYGSEEDKAQCLGLETVEGRQLERVKRWIFRESNSNTGQCNNQNNTVSCAETSANDGTHQQRPSLVDRVCEPGRIFMQDCNTCQCNTQGTAAICTQKVCHENCRPGSIKFVNCNVCLCHGHKWKCTNMNCPPERNPTLCPSSAINDHPACRQGRRYKRELRTETSTKSYVCLGEKSHLKNCNTCRPPGCQPNVGQPKPFTTTVRTPPVCLPEKSYLKNCNTCRCPDGSGYPCNSGNCQRGVMLKPASLWPSLRRSAQRRQPQPELEEVDYSQTLVKGRAQLQSAEQRQPQREPEEVDYSQTLGFRRKRSPQISWRERPRPRCVSLAQRGVRGHNQATLCVPGTSFMLRCNRCMCRQSGRSAVCTTFNCVERVMEVCTPGSAKTIDCNICICSPQEKWVCTQKQCKSEQGGASHYPQEDCETESEEIGRAPNQQCRPGTSFRSGCSRCYCSPDGMSVVCRSQPCHGVSGTLLPLQSNCGHKDGCSGNDQVDSHGEKGEGGGGGGGRKEKSGALTLLADHPCQAGDIVYEDKCVTCYCLLDRASTLCLIMDCEPTDIGSGPLERFVFGKPSTRSIPLVIKRVKCSSSPTVFSEGCNYCVCEDKNSGPVCTNWPCTDSRRTHSAPKRMKRSPQHCEPYTAYTKDCNACFCNRNGTNAVCTNFECNTGTQRA
ncbi:uncharacterized protein LOC126284338 isoform X3 [Schistocerca gregaria]|nr:uncharacterized protein LOC126284338 isoform X3 [Schistocerca gregaria]